MPKPARIPQSEAPTSYGARIREHVEQDEVEIARGLAAEALREGVQEPGLDHWVQVLAPAKVLGVHPATGTDVRRDVRWLDKHQQEYRGQWVAVLAGEMLAHAETYEGLKDRLAQLSPAGHPLVHFVA
jgi:hypothetical protein